MFLQSQPVLAGVYIRADGTTDPLASRIPFAAGLSVPENVDVYFGAVAGRNMDLLLRNIAGTYTFSMSASGVTGSSVGTDVSIASGTSVNGNAGTLTIVGGTATGGGQGGNINITSGVSGVANGGIISISGGAAAATQGYTRIGATGTPNKLDLSSSNINATSSLYIKGALEVDSTLFADGSLLVVGQTTLATTLNGFLKATAGVVSASTSVDISSDTNLAVTSPITLTGDTVGFDQNANFTWGGAHSFTSTLNKNFSDVLTGLQLTQTVDISSICIEFIPQKYNDTTGLGGEPPVKKWTISMSTPADFPGSLNRMDRTFAIGYNMTNGGGTQYDSGDATCGWVIEDYYNPSGTTRNFEIYIQSTWGPGPSDAVRPIFATVNYPTGASNTAPDIGISLSYGPIGRVSFQNAITGVQYFSMFNSLFILNPGSVIYKAGNNQKWLLQENNAASATKSLAYLDSSDLVRLGDTGISVKTIENLTLPDNKKLFLGDNASANGNVSFRIDVASTNNILMVTENGYSGTFDIQAGILFNVADSVTFCTSGISNLALIGPTLVAAQATPGGATHGLYVRKQASSTTGIIAGVMEAEFSSSSNNFTPVQGLNIFAHTATGTVGNLSQATGGGGLRGSRIVTRHRGTTGTIARATGQCAQWTQDASTGTTTDYIGFLIEAPTIGSSATTTNWYGTKYETASVTGTITNAYFQFIPVLSHGTNKFEVWYDTSAATYYRESGNKINSSAGATLDITATTTLNLSIGGTAQLAIASNAITVKDSLNFVFNTSTGSKHGTATDQKQSLWNATPIVQPASANQAALTNSTGGAYDGTLVDVGVVFNQANINNNFTDIYTLLDAIRTAMVNYGSMKGAA